MSDMLPPVGAYKYGNYVFMFHVRQRKFFDYVRTEVLTAVIMKNAVFCNTKNPVRTSQETHYVSATEPSQLMLCKI
jgi:hypothetical protein